LAAFISVAAIMPQRLRSGKEQCEAAAMRSYCNQRIFRKAE
jgi:hypothetical protein